MVSRFADYCLESITINRLIGDLDNSAANNDSIIASAKSVDAQRRLSIQPFATVR